MESFSFSSEYFSPRDTLTCGQVFRFTELDERTFAVYSMGHKCVLRDCGDTVVMESDNIEYFKRYFDIDRDYGRIVGALSGFSELTAAVDFGKGIRILRQNFDESVFSFIISANNNIKRIQGIIERLCQRVGDNCGDYYAFPTAEQIQTLSEDELLKMGLGYRARYMYEASRQLPTLRDAILAADEQESKRLLCSIMGVGPKVANCIMLFGLGITTAYPVDTWIFKQGRTELLDTPQKVERFYRERYGELAGFAQQYIFHHARNQEK